MPNNAWPAFCVIERLVTFGEKYDEISKNACVPIIPLTQLVLDLMHSTASDLLHCENYGLEARVSSSTVYIIQLTTAKYG